MDFEPAEPIGEVELAGPVHVVEDRSGRDAAAFGFQLPLAGGWGKGDRFFRGIPGGRPRAEDGLVR